MVFIQKDILPRTLYWLLRKINSRIVYDFDDAIYELNPFLNHNPINRFILRYQNRMFGNMVKGAKWVIAANEALALVILVLSGTLSNKEDAGRRRSPRIDDLSA